MTQYSIQQPGPVRRLHVVWRKGRWSVVNEVQIPSMTLVRSDDLPPSDKGVSGFWWEAVDEQGNVIYRHMISDPFSLGMEVFEADGKITRIPHQGHEEVSFDVLVPDLPQVAQVHFYSSANPNHEHMRQGPAERIAALNVRKRQGGRHGNR